MYHLRIGVLYLQVLQLWIPKRSLFLQKSITQQSKRRFTAKNSVDHKKGWTLWASFLRNSCSTLRRQLAKSKLFLEIEILIGCNKLTLWFFFSRRWSPTWNDRGFEAQGRHPGGCQQDRILQAREPDDLRLGNQRKTYRRWWVFISFICSFVYKFVCSFFRLFFCSSVCLFVWSSVHLFVWVFVFC